MRRFRHAVFKVVTGLAGSFGRGLPNGKCTTRGESRRSVPCAKRRNRRAPNGARDSMEWCGLCPPRSCSGPPRGVASRGRFVPKSSSSFSALRIPVFWQASMPDKYGANAPPSPPQSSELSHLGRMPFRHSSSPSAPAASSRGAAREGDRQVSEDLRRRSVQLPSLR